YVIAHESECKCWWMTWPFSVYTAWIAVATIANVFLALDSIGVDLFLGLGDLQWTVILLVVGTLIGSLVAIRYQDLLFVAVFLWAYVAITIENAGTTPVLLAAMLCIIFLGAVFGNLFHKKRIAY
ncbi:MAG: hypothetical protein ACRC5C_08570, partial [Bacilli bacterium]